MSCNNVNVITADKHRLEKKNVKKISSIPKSEYLGAKVFQKDSTKNGIKCYDDACLC